MKKKLMAFIMALCLLMAAVRIPASSAGTVIFTAIDNKLLPLTDSTMPVYYNGNLYIPYDIFDSTGINCLRTGDGNIISLYIGLKHLQFNLEHGTTVNDTGYSYPGVSARSYNGTAYVPAALVCNFFNYSFSMISASPADVFRIKTTAEIVDDRNFVGISVIKNQMQAAYDALMGSGASSAPPVTDVPTGTPSTEPPPAKVTYEDVTLYLSFSSAAAGALAPILDLLYEYRIQCCFFLTAEDILNDPELIRRAAGDGHRFGIWLTQGTPEEYARTDDLLFEAAKLRTVLVAAAPEADESAQALAASRGLVRWRFADSFGEDTPLLPGDVTERLPTGHGVRYAALFTCTENVENLLPDVLSYILDNQYTVRRPAETAPPVIG